MSENITPRPLERRVSGVTAPAEGVAKKHFCRFWLSYMARPRRRRPNRQWRSNTRRLAWNLGYVGDIGEPGLPGIPFERLIHDFRPRSGAAINPHFGALPCQKASPFLN